ncbi:hypothetical protein O181_009571 [Austropuccinia psidii MF-1]|uniref:Uncharacterized protein n=1 Tax=Austropuccinia psidii MF-1 TaxID=1389203 RepID=A0A9Q3GJL3_9BASI|nr:hypothetical protein [Austropuccinia psidii MF-1]
MRHFYPHLVSPCCPLLWDASLRSRDSSRYQVFLDRLMLRASSSAYCFNNLHYTHPPFGMLWSVLEVKFSRCETCDEISPTDSSKGVQKGQDKRIIIMKLVGINSFVFLASSHFKGSLELSNSIMKGDKGDYRMINLEGSSVQPMEFFQPSVAQNVERHELKGKLRSRERKESKIQKKLSLNRGRIQKLSRGYRAMKKSINVLQNKQLPKVASLLTPNDAELNLRKSKLAELRQNISVGKRPTNYIRKLEADSKIALESYKDKAKSFIQICEEIYKEVENVDTHISLFVENHLPKLADLTSVWIRNEPESEISPIGWKNFPQNLPSMGLKHNQVDSFKAFSSRERIIPEDIVDMINERRISDVATELNRILRKLNSLLLIVDGSRHEKQLSLATRVSFETYIYQALNFLYENQLCTQEVLKTFFSTENTLERTYEHLRDLFNRRTVRGEDLYFSLMPELSFVVNDWNTAHLHNLLRDLDKVQQARLVEIMLIDSIKSFKQSSLFYDSSPEIRMIIDAVTEDRILKYWWLNTSPNSYPQKAVGKWISQLARFFAKTDNSTKRFEYLISYYLLNFIKTYSISDIATLPFKKIQKNVLYNTKFEIFQAGIRLHEAVNRSFDYRNLVRLPSNQRLYLTTQITAKMAESAEIEIVDKAKEYQFLKATIESFAEEDQALSNWMRKNFFLRFYDNLLVTEERRNMWSYGQLPIARIKTEYYYLPPKKR